MSRNDFELVARALRDAKPIRIADNDPRLIPWTNCVIEVARLFAGLSARFNRDKFLDACAMHATEQALIKW